MSTFCHLVDKRSYCSTLFCICTILLNYIIKYKVLKIFEDVINNTSSVCSAGAATTFRGIGMASLVILLIFCFIQCLTGETEGKGGRLVFNFLSTV